jgi:putative sterol carrier protein
MATTTTPGSTSPSAAASGPQASNGLASLPADAISYEDLYARWERGNWSAMELDFSEDARQWREQFSEFERKAALWNYALFFWGEDAVADNLSPYIDAAPREQVDEARHAVFFKRFMQEVVGLGDGTAASGLNAIKHELTPGFRRVFDRLDRMAVELRADRSRPKLAEAVALYHFVIEAGLAQTGQHMICRYLEERDLLPAFRAGMANVALDEQRHIGFGVKLLCDLNREDPRVAGAVARLLREILPYTGQVLQPPGWDERYLTCFGTSYDEVGHEGVVSLQTKLRAAGLPHDRFPGSPVMPPGLTPTEIAAQGRMLSMAGIIGVREGPSKRDPETLELLFEMIRRQVNPEHGLRRPTTFQWEFTDPDVPTWHLIVDNGSSRVAQGAAAKPDLRLRVGYQDFVDVIGNRLNPVRAVIMGKLRPRGNPLALRALTRVFPRD